MLRSSDNAASPVAAAAPPPYQRFALAACMFLTIASFGFLEPFMPLYLERSGLTRGQIGMVSGIGTGLALLIQPFLGRLSDRLDRRRPIMFCAALAAGVAYLLYRQASGLVTFILLAALGINGIMYLNTASAVLVGRMAAALQAERGSSGSSGGGTFAAYRVWGSVGYVVVSLLSGFFLSRIAEAQQGEMTRSSLSPLFLYGPMLFFLIAVVVLFLPDPKRQEASAAVSDSGAEDEETPQARLCILNLNRFLRAHFLCIFAYCGSVSYLSLHLRTLGATPFLITSIFATGVACEALLMTQTGRLSDRFGRRPLLAIALLMMPVRLALYAVVASPVAALFVQTIHGVNFGILAAVAVTFANDLCSERNRGVTQARLAASGGLAAALGPAAGGWLSQYIGIRGNFAVMAGVAALGAVVFLWKVRESISVQEPLHRRGPALMRAVAGALTFPVGRLRHRPKG